MATNMIAINIVVKDGNGSAAISQMQRELAKLGEAATQAGKGIATAHRGFGQLAAGGNQAAGALHGTVSGVQAASAALRELSGDFTNNIRAVERFVTTIPGVADALKGIFPLVGALALAGLLAEVSIKFIDFVKTANAVPNSIADAFRSLGNEGRMTNNELDLANVKLENEIAKLEHKPQNALAESLAETRTEADRLADSLDKDYQKIKGILGQKDNQVSLLGGIFTNQEPTAIATGTINSFNREIADLGAQYAKYKSAGDDDGAATERRALNAKILAAQQTVGEMLGHAQNLQSSAGFVNGIADQSAVINETSAAMQHYSDLNRHISLQDRNDKDQKAAEALRKAKELQDQQRQDAQRATEAANKAAELRLKAMESGLVQQQSIYGKNIFAEEAYWNARVNAFTKGSNQYDTVQARALEAREKAGAAELETLKKSRESKSEDATETVRMGDLGGKLSESESQDQLHTGERYTQYRSELYKSEAEPEAQKNALDAVNLSQSEVSGTVSRYNAAVQTAALHTREYAASVAELQARLADLKNQNLTPEQYQTQTLGLKNQVQQSGDNRAIQVIQDNANIDDTKLGSAWKRSLDLYVQEAQDAAKQIGDIFTSTLNSVNSSLATALTAYYHTPRERWRALRNGLGDDVRGAGSKIANYGLQSAEGGVLGALGFGGAKKADGSQDRPFFVRLVNALQGTGNAALGKLGLGGGETNTGLPGFLVGLARGRGGMHALNTLGGSDPLGLNGTSSVSDDGSNFGTGGGFNIGGLFSNISFPGVQWAFASGGPVVSNMPALVGEKGPELFIPHSAGTIVPNSAMGGSVNHNYSIDARGAVDPAATAAMVQRAIAQATPGIVARSAAYQSDRSRRMPSTQR